MKLNTNVIDLWTFFMDGDMPRYLLLHASPKKSEEWFKGGDIWQIPGALLPEGYELSTVEILHGCLQNFGLQAKALWTVEEAYTKYNPHRDCLEIVPVFAAFVDPPESIPLTWHHDEYRWAVAEEAYELVRLAGLRQGLTWVREQVTEIEEQRPELRLA